jgi:hypothetical protein
LNKQKHLYSKTENRKLKQVPSGYWYQWEGAGYKERAKEAKSGGNAIYLCMKMEK